MFSNCKWLQTGRTPRASNRQGIRWPHNGVIIFGSQHLAMEISVVPLHQRSELDFSTDVSQNDYSRHSTLCRARTTTASI